MDKNLVLSKICNIFSDKLLEIPFNEDKDILCFSDKCCDLLRKHFIYKNMSEDQICYELAIYLDELFSLVVKNYLDEVKCEIKGEFKEGKYFLLFICMTEKDVCKLVWLIKSILDGSI